MPPKKTETKAEGAVPAAKPKTTTNQPSYQVRAQDAGVFG